MVQTAEGALTEVHSMLQRIRELAVEAANSTVGTADAASVNTEIVNLQAEINRIAQKTTFNGQNLLTGALSVAQNTGAPTSLVMGASLSTGHNASVARVDVSGARANTTYTMTSQVGGKVTLSDGTTGQQVTLAATIGSTGTEVINFGNLGVKITIVGDSAKTATELATDLAAGGVATKAIGGNLGANLFPGDVLGSTSINGVTPNAPVSYHAASGGLDPSYPLWAHAVDGGVPQGTLTLAVDGVTGVITGSVGGENFTGHLSSPVNGQQDLVDLHGSRGNDIDLVYQQGTGANWAQEAADMNGASFTFVADPFTTASVTAMTAASTATAGTYTFTLGSSSGGWSTPGSLTLSGPGGTQTVSFPYMGPNATDHLDFFSLGITLDIHAGPGGFEGDAVVTDLLGATNNTIVVTSSGGGPTQNKITTGTGVGATFQIGANQGDTMGVSFSNAQTAAYGNTAGAFDTAISNFGTSPNNTTAGVLISETDAAIAYVSNIRGNYGASQNRLQHTIASVSVASENLNASESRIRDLDIAAEMVNFTKTSILQQAGTSILAQANSAPQNILTLLR
jgi:flagellin